MNSIFDYFKSIDTELIEFIEDLPEEAIGKSISIFNGESFEFQPNSVVFFGVPEDRYTINNKGTGANLNAFRKQFYQMFVGHWKTKIYDLGDLRIGNSVSDTEIALNTIITTIIKEKAIPFIVGGSHALTYTMYRAFDSLEQRVNLSVVDSEFNLGNINDTINSKSYLNKIIMDKPNNLNNFSNIGFQTFKNSQEEILLLDDLFFDTYRLGEIKNDLELVEPILRNTTILSIDIEGICRNDAPAHNNNGISGFSAEDICVIARYAGLSDGLKAMGVFEYNSALEKTPITAELLAQILWYFVEGVSSRFYEFPNNKLNGFKKFMVIIENDTYNFYKSNKSNRWWMEIFLEKDNKPKRRSLIPCTYGDYLSATQEVIPKRWYDNRKKLL